MWLGLDNSTNMLGLGKKTVWLGLDNSTNILG